MAFHVAVAGFGARGLEWTRAIRESGFATLVGIADPDEAARARAAADHRLKGISIEPDLETLLHASAPDAVVVAVPPDQHARVARLAIGLRLSVLVEKPFTLDLPSAVDVVRAAESQNVALLVAQNYRYMRAHRTVRRILDDQMLGPLSEVACHYWRASHTVNPWLAALEAPVLWETAVHHLDALRYCLGRRIVGVAGDVSGAPGRVDFQGASARVLLEFEGGLPGTYSVSWDAVGHEFFEQGQQFYERLSGSRGTLHVVQRWLLLCLRDRWPRVVRRGPRVESEEVVLLRQLTAAHTGHARSDCSGRDNLQTLAVIAACVKSWRSKQWINPQDLLRDAGA